MRKMTAEDLEAQLLRTPRPRPSQPQGTKRLFLELSISANTHVRDALDPQIDISDAEEEPEAKRKRVHELSNDLRDLVLERLLATRPHDSSSFRYTVPQVLEFFQANHAKTIGNFLSLRTLYDWRAAAEHPKSSASNKVGAPFVLSVSHRVACGQLLKEMGNAGSPMNSKIARPVLVGYLKSHSLLHLYSPKASKGKISFSKSWILGLFEEFDLADRAGTTDKQKLPEVPFINTAFLSYFIFILLCRIGVNKFLQ